MRLTMYYVIFRICIDCFIDIVTSNFYVLLENNLQTFYKKCFTTQPIMKRKNLIGSISNLLNFSDCNSFFTFCCCYKSYFCTHCTLIVLTVFTPKLSIFDDKRFTFLRFTAPTNIYFHIESTSKRIYFLDSFYRWLYAM